MHIIFLILSLGAWSLALWCDANYLFSPKNRPWYWHCWPLAFAVFWIRLVFLEGYGPEIFLQFSGFPFVAPFALTPIAKWFLGRRRTQNKASGLEAVLFSLVLCVAGVACYENGTEARQRKGKMFAHDQLLKCIDSENLECTESLARALPDINGPMNSDKNESVLQYAVRNGKLNVSKRLLDMGVSPDSNGGFGLNPLETAVAQGNSEMVVLLLDRHAKLKSSVSNVSLIDSLCWNERENGAAGLLIARKLIQKMKEARVAISERERKRCVDLLTKTRLNPGPNSNLRDLEEIVRLVSEY